MDRLSSSEGPLQEGLSPNAFDFNSRDVNVAATLTLPQDIHDDVPVASSARTASDGPSEARWDRYRELRPVILIFCLSFVFAILYCLFIIVVLIQGRVETPPRVFW